MKRIFSLSGKEKFVMQRKGYTVIFEFRKIENWPNHTYRTKLMNAQINYENGKSITCDITINNDDSIHRLTIKDNKGNIRMLVRSTSGEGYTDNYMSCEGENTGEEVQNFLQKPELPQTILHLFQMVESSYKKQKSNR